MTFSVTDGLGPKIVNEKITELLFEPLRLVLLTNDGVVLAYEPSESRARKTAEAMGLDPGSWHTEPIDPVKDRARRAEARERAKKIAMDQQSRFRGRRAASAITRKHAIILEEVTPEIAQEWRIRRAQGEPCKKIAAEVDACASLVGRVCRGEVLRSAGGPFTYRRTA